MRSMQMTEDRFEMEVAMALMEAAEYAEGKRIKKALETSAVYFMSWPEAKQAYGKKKAKKLWERGDG